MILTWISLLSQRVQLKDTTNYRLCAIGALFHFQEAEPLSVC